MLKLGLSWTDIVKKFNIVPAPLPSGFFFLRTVNTIVFVEQQNFYRKQRLLLNIIVKRHFYYYLCCFRSNAKSQNESCSPTVFKRL